MENINKTEQVKLWLSVGLSIFGGLMLIAGFCVPPIGVIDSSVLIAFGEVLTFAGAVLGINYSYQIKLAEIKRDTINKIGGE